MRLFHGRLLSRGEGWPAYFQKANKRFGAAEKHALTVCQPQQSRHGPRRTYCDGSRVIPFEMTAHTMGCDDDKARPSCKGCSEQSKLLEQQEAGAAWGAPNRKTRDFPRNKGEENLIIY